MGAKQSARDKPATPAAVAPRSIFHICLNQGRSQAVVKVDGRGFSTAMTAMPASVRDVHFVLRSVGRPPLDYILPLLLRWTRVDSLHLHHWTLYDEMAALMALRPWRVLEAPTIQRDSNNTDRWKKLVTESFRGQHLSLSGVLLYPDQELQSHLVLHMRDKPPSTLRYRSSERSDGKTLACPDAVVGDSATWEALGFSELIVIGRHEAGPGSGWLDETFSTGGSWVRVEYSDWDGRSAGADWCILDADILGLPLETKVRCSENWLARWAVTLGRECNLPSELVAEVADHVFERDRARRLRRLLAKQNVCVV